jgi:hypothetical protein
MEQQQKKEKDSTTGKGYFWLIMIFLSFIGLIVAFAWFVSNKDYEPAFTLIGAVGAFFTLLFRKGLRGLIFGLGIVAGAVIASLLLVFVPQFGSKEIKAELTQSTNEKKTLEEENIVLKKRITELESTPSTPTPMPSSRLDTPDSVSPVQSNNTDTELIKTKNNLRVEVLETQLKDSTFTVTLLLKSIDVDQRVYSDKDYARFTAQSGEYREPNFQAQGSNKYSDFDKNLIAGDPLKVQCIFNKIPNTIDTINTFEIRFDVNSSRELFQFKNLKANTIYRKLN